MGALQKAQPTGKLYEKIDNFSGGINATEENDKLLDSEFRDLINWDLESLGSLKKRLGTKVIVNPVKDIKAYLIKHGLIAKNSTDNDVRDYIGEYNNLYYDEASGTAFIFFNQFAWNINENKEMKFFTYRLGDGEFDVNPDTLGDNKELDSRYFQPLRIKLNQKVSFQILGVVKKNFYAITDNGYFQRRLDGNWYKVLPYVPSVGTYKQSLGNMLAAGYKAPSDGEWGEFWNWDWVNQSMLWSAPISTPIGIIPKQIVSNSPNAFRLVVASNERENIINRKHTTAIWRLKYADSDKFYILKRTKIGDETTARAALQIDGISGIDSDTAILEAVLVDASEKTITPANSNLFYEDNTSFWVNLGVEQTMKEHNQWRGVERGCWSNRDGESSLHFGNNYKNHPTWKNDLTGELLHNPTISPSDLPGGRSYTMITAFGNKPFNHTNWEKDLMIPNTNIFGAGGDVWCNEIPSSSGSAYYSVLSDTIETSLMTGMQLRIDDSFKDQLINPGFTEDISYLQVDWKYSQQVARFNQNLLKWTGKKNDIRINTSIISYLTFAEGTKLDGPLGKWVKKYAIPDNISSRSGGSSFDPIKPIQKSYYEDTGLLNLRIFRSDAVYWQGETDGGDKVRAIREYNQKKYELSKSNVDKYLIDYNDTNPDRQHIINVNKIVFPSSAFLGQTVLSGLHPGAPDYWACLKVGSQDTTYHEDLIKNVCPLPIPGAEKALAKVTSGTKIYNDSLDAFYIRRESNDMTDFWSGDQANMTAVLTDQIKNFKSWLNETIAKAVEAGEREADLIEDINNLKLAVNFNLLLNIAGNGNWSNGAQLELPYAVALTDLYHNGMSNVNNAWQGRVIGAVPPEGFRGTQLINAPDSYSLQQSLKTLGDLHSILPGADALRVINRPNASTLYNGQLLMWNEKTDILFYSNPNTYNYFPLINTLQTNTAEQEEISNVVPFNSMALILTKNSIYGLRGEYVGNFKTKVMNNNIGAFAPRATVTIDNKIYFISRKGAYSASYVFGTDGSIKVEPLDHKISMMYTPSQEMIGVDYSTSTAKYWIILDPKTNFIYSYNVNTKVWSRDKFDLVDDEIVDLKVSERNIFYVTKKGKIIRRYNKDDLEEVKNVVGKTDKYTQHFLLTRLYYDAFEEDIYFNKMGSSDILNWEMRPDPEHDLFDYIDYGEAAPDKEGFLHNVYYPVEFARKYMVDHDYGHPINSILVSKEFSGLGDAVHNRKKWKEIQVKLTNDSLDKMAYMGILVDGNPTIWPYEVVVLQNNVTGEITSQEVLLDQATAEHFDPLDQTILYGEYNRSQPSKALLSFNRGTYLNDTFIVGGRTKLDGRQFQYLGGRTASNLGPTPEFNYRVKKGKKGYAEQIYLENSNDLPFGIKSFLLVYKFKRPK